MRHLLHSLVNELSYRVDIEFWVEDTNAFRLTLILSNQLE